MSDVRWAIWDKQMQEYRSTQVVGYVSTLMFPSKDHATRFYDDIILDPQHYEIRRVRIVREAEGEPNA